MRANVVKIRGPVKRSLSVYVCGYQGGYAVPSLAVVLVAAHCGVACALTWIYLVVMAARADYASSIARVVAS